MIQYARTNSLTTARVLTHIEIDPITCDIVIHGKRVLRKHSKMFDFQLVVFFNCLFSQATVGCCFDGSKQVIATISPIRHTIIVFIVFKYLLLLIENCFRHATVVDVLRSS